MRFNVFALTALLPAAGLLSGCAMGTQGLSSAASADPAVKSISGKAFGGQQAVADGQIVVYQYGSSGYGSSGQAIAVTTTDSSGNFNVNYTCSNPNGPVYILSIGGQPGINLPTNSAIVLGAGIGSCAASETGFVTINEISTTALAFALSHFFSSSSPDLFTADHFGSPGSLTPAITRVNSGLIPTMIDPRSGLPILSTSTFTNETAKIITIADVIGACVNSSGPGSPACVTLFSKTTPASGTAPTDTLQAAINMALNPKQNVADLYALVPPSGSSAFTGSLSTQPNDWTLAVSYTAPSLGLGVDVNNIPTLDIDTSGRVWFANNVSGSAGVASFDPSTSSFSAPFTAPGLVRPEQVAIDINGTAWVNDAESAVIAGFPTANPSSPTVLTLPGTTSTALTVADDNSLRVAVVNTATATPALATVSSDDTTYAVIPNSTPQGSQGYIGASLAGDLVGGAAVSATDTLTPNVFDLYLGPNFSEQAVAFNGFADSGQVAFTGNDYVSVRGGFSASGDGICIFSAQNCFSMTDQAADRHPVGLAVDGSGALWLSDGYTQDVQQIARTNGSYLNGGQVPNQVYMHGTNNGGTLNSPVGIAVDSTGNVWVSNQGCYQSGCTPAPFVLTEIVGAGVPTVNPVSAQVVLNSSPGTEPSVVKSKSKAN